MNFRRPFAVLVLLTFLVAALGAFVTCLQNSEISLSHILRGGLHGVCMGLPGLFIAIFIFPYIKPWRRRLPLILDVLFFSGFYFLLILAGRGFAFWVTGARDFALLGRDENFAGAVVIALMLTIFGNFILKLSRIIGRNELFNFFVGRYRRPQLEHRMIMFLDLKGSTTITERIGDLKYLRLLDQFFLRMTPALRASGGSIHKYIGDEAIITWPHRATAATGLEFVRQFRQRIDQDAPFFEQRFGLQPRFRASLHYGEILIGEVGDIKKEIAYLGDALNTAARLIDFGKTTGYPVTVSESVPGISEWSAKTDLGSHQLKGKEGSLRLYGVKQFQETPTP